MGKNRQISNQVRAAAGVIALAALIAGCAQQANRRLDDRIAQTPPPASSEALNQETRQTIANAPGLTDRQREQLEELRKKVATEIAKHQDESARLRRVLIQDVVSAQYNAKEVALVKKRIRAAEKKRLDALFRGIDQANVILGRTQANSADVIDEMFGGARAGASR